MPSEYPHMMPEDVPVWRGFLKAGGIEGATYEYDVKVGLPINDLADMPEPYASNAQMLSKKRIDVLATTPEAIFVIEVKDTTGWAAIGQALGYRLLYIRDFRPKLDVTPLIVAREFPPDIVFILTELQIPYLQVDELVMQPLTQEPS